MSENLKVFGNYSAENLIIVYNKNKIFPKNYTIENFEMTFSENVHTLLKMSIMVKEDSFNEWAFVINERSYMDKNDSSLVLVFDGNSHFSGIIKNITRGEYNDRGYLVELVVESKSIIMDRTRYVAVYQNPNLTYFDIIKDITDEYTDKVHILGITNSKENSTSHNELNTRISNGLLVQYNETDWEFISRILSHLGLALYNHENGSVLIGFHKQIMSTDIDPIQTNRYETMEKMGVQLLRSKKLDGPYLHMGGNKLYLNGNLLGYVAQGKIICREDKFFGEYILRDYEYIHPLIYNEKIKGATLEGKVKRTPYSTQNKIGAAAMTIDFIDGVKLKAGYLQENNQVYKVTYRNDMVISNHKLERYQFPYVTPYSKTKTGLFCAPEIGDNVLVYFSSNIEADAFVIGAAKNERSLRFTNPFERNYVTTQDERTLFGKLDSDLSEENNTKDMLESVEACTEKLFNFSVASDKLGIYLKDTIYEETKQKSVLTHENCSIVSKNSYNLNSEEISVTANSNYEEKADKKSENIDSKTGIYNSKEESANSISTITNNHSVKIR
ncbi:MAG: hypothetical protein LBT51_04370 [Fusobacteriaceae bacterium]|jgi:hypothetical protein|nr:hypothetical protein [Fusobacteriaceae bacterium]